MNKENLDFNLQDFKVSDWQLTGGPEVSLTSPVN